jgi:hypothetical protein
MVRQLLDDDERIKLSSLIIDEQSNLPQNSSITVHMSTTNDHNNSNCDDSNAVLNNSNSITEQHDVDEFISLKRADLALEELNYSMRRPIKIMRGKDRLTVTSDYEYERDYDNSLD